MQQAPPTPRPASPLTIPHAFRRATGAHAIIASILVADLLGVLIWVLLGAFSGPPIWWLLRAFVHLLHASLGFDLVLILVLGCVASQYFLRSWVIPGTLMVFIVVITCVLWLLRPGVMAIPSPIPAFVPRETPSWRFLFLPQGAILALVLSVVAHVLSCNVLRRKSWHVPSRCLAPIQATRCGVWSNGRMRSLARTSAASSRRSSASSKHPIRSATTSNTSLPTRLSYWDPEHEMYWQDGTLVLNQEYIGPNDEQANVLLPVLACLLAHNTWATHFIGFLFRLAHTARQQRLTARLLAVPLYVEARGKELWDRQAYERVIDGDWYSYACGQGPRLQRLLHTLLDARTANHLPDNSIPTLNERIHHLSGLIYQEEQQMQRLRATVSSSLTPPTS